MKCCVSSSLWPKVAPKLSFTLHELPLWLNAALKFILKLRPSRNFCIIPIPCRDVSDLSLRGYKTGSMPRAGHVRRAASYYTKETPGYRYVSAEKENRHRHRVRKGSWNIPPRAPVCMLLLIGAWTRTSFNPRDAGPFAFDDFESYHGARFQYITSLIIYRSHVPNEWFSCPQTKVVIKFAARHIPPTPQLYEVDKNTLTRMKSLDVITADSRRLSFLSRQSRVKRSRSP